MLKKLVIIVHCNFNQIPHHILFPFFFFLFLHLLHLLAIGGCHEGLFVGEFIALGLSFLLYLTLKTSFFLAVPNLGVLQKVLDVAGFSILQQVRVVNMRLDIITTYKLYNHRLNMHIFYCKLI
jgi:hypothetical protein